MAIYLDQQTRPYLERLIKKQIEKSEKDFIAVRIKDMLETDRRRIENCEKCDHEYIEYVGERISCCKCDDFLQETWNKKKS
jgi:hypothetical protein